MATTGKSWSKATAICPRPEHAGSRVRFDGTYGKPGHRRQRYRCSPADGSKGHVFTETLPREESWRASCDLCERGIHRHEGPHAARQYQFVARGIAGALKAVGAGQSYRQASLVARERAQRLRPNPTTGQVLSTRHGQLVGDWVEVFAPVVFERHRQTAWPTGSLVLDDLPFRVRDPNDPGQSRVAFRVYVAVGYSGEEATLWHMQALPDATAASWGDFLRRLTGAPSRVVCDNHGGLTSAVRSVFPQADLYLCEWHLAHALRRLMHSISRQNPHLATDLAELADRIGGAFFRSTWPIFEGDCRALGEPRLDRWFDQMAPVIQAQFAQRGLHSQRPKSWPITTGALEALARPIGAVIEPRRYGLTNRERTNRLLMLLQLHANRQDNERSFTKDLREHLEANAGRPLSRRRAVTDALGAPSLR